MTARRSDEPLRRCGWHRRASVTPTPARWIPSPSPAAHRRVGLDRRDLDSRGGRPWCLRGVPGRGGQHSPRHDLRPGQAPAQVQQRAECPGDRLGQPEGREQAVRRQPRRRPAALGSFEQINTTFANGGPGCLWKTIEHTTGIRIDHFIELNFTGFIHVVNDIGGVNVCLPFAVNNTLSGLHLSAGRHHVGGQQALAFWRTRENIGEGSDLQRIQRDQFLMASLLQGVQRSNILGSPTTLLSVVKDIASAMTTDMDTSSLLQTAESVKGLSTKSVEFVQVPSVTATQNANWVTWTPQSAALFGAVAHDRKLPKAGKNPTAPTTTPVLEASPSQVNVQVLNGSGVGGVASTVAASLASRSFHVAGTGDAANFGYTNSVIEYASPADKPAVKTLKHQLSNVTVQQDSSLTPGTLVLIIGSSYQGLRTSTSPSPTPTKPAVGSLAKSFNGITGDARCSSDGAAFTGPNSPPVP